MSNLAKFSFLALCLAKNFEKERKMIAEGQQAVSAKICYTLRGGLNTQQLIESVTIIVKGLFVYFTLNNVERKNTSNLIMVGHLL